MRHSGSVAVEGDVAFSRGVVFKGDVVVKSACSGFKTLAAGTRGMEGGGKAVVELCVAATRHPVQCYDSVCAPIGGAPFYFAAEGRDAPDQNECKIGTVDRFRQDLVEVGRVWPSLVNMCLILIPFY